MGVEGKLGEPLSGELANRKDGHEGNERKDNQGPALVWVLLGRSPAEKPARSQAWSVGGWLQG